VWVRWVVDGWRAYKGLVLLKGLARKVEREIVGIDHTAQESEVLGQERIELLGNEDTPDVELDALLASGGIELGVRGSLGQEHDGLEGTVVTLGGEVDVGERRPVLPGDGLEEVLVLLPIEAGTRESSAS
jgi:hypothetical protein